MDRTTARVLDPSDDVMWCILGALLVGLVLAFAGHQLCTTGTTAGQLIDGTDRDVRCHAAIHHRGLLYALLAVVPMAATAAAGMRGRRAAMVAAVVSVLALAAYLTYVGAAPSSSPAP